MWFNDLPWLDHRSKRCPNAIEPRTFDGFKLTRFGYMPDVAETEVLKVRISFPTKTWMSNFKWLKRYSC